MADVATRIARDGYGQVELNQVAFRRDGRIEAQCKIAAGIDYLENGMLLAIDPVARTVGYPTADAQNVVLNYTTEHMYDERLVHALKDFKLDKNSFLPRLGYLARGDKYTSNCVSFPQGDTYANEAAFWTAVDNCGTVKMYGHASVDGSVLVNAVANGAVLQVVKRTKMPDGQKAIKFIAL